jgi:arabinose-5-phosphate isomerase
VPRGTRVADAVELMRRLKISELPVLNDDGEPVGLLDVTDLIGFVPAEAAGEPPRPRARIGA